MRAMSGPRPRSRDVPDPAPSGELSDDDPDRWWETPEAPDDLTYDRAAAETPDDPDPARMPADPPAGDIRVTARVRRDIEGKTAFWLLVGTDLWGTVDGHCAGIAGEQVDKIAKKAAPILCQSPQIVNWFMRASGFMMWTELLMACKPVAVAVMAHHITKTVQTTKDRNGKTVTEEVDWSAYTAA